MPREPRERVPRQHVPEENKLVGGCGGKSGIVVGAGERENRVPGGVGGDECECERVVKEDGFGGAAGEGVCGGRRGVGYGVHGGGVAGEEAAAAEGEFRGHEEVREVGGMGSCWGRREAGREEHVT